jgi:glycosyltransferase involved in cell wall biosynthesis
MKIGMVTTWACRCGIFTYSQNLSNALAGLGHEVYVVRVPRFGRKVPGVFYDVVERIPKEVDIVHVQHEYGIWQGLEGAFYGALAQLGKKVVTTMHAIGNYELDGIIGSVSDKLVVHNEYCFNRSIFPEKTVIIPHGAKASATVPAGEAKKAIGINPEYQIVGYLGFVAPQKGLETLIEAMAKIPKAGLLLGGGWHTEGQTDYMMRLKHMTSELLPHRCYWMGYVAEEDLSRFYSAIDVFVYPPRATTESGALLMALGHGKAVIASALPPMREKEKLGALMTFDRNAKDLEEKINLLLSDAERRSKLEEGARDYVEGVKWSHIAEKHISLYEGLLSA